jgi:hypothetical protein
MRHLCGKVRVKRYILLLASIAAGNLPVSCVEENTMLRKTQIGPLMALA